jgi:hypothetical protein
MEMDRCDKCGTLATDDGPCRWCLHLTMQDQDDQWMQQAHEQVRTGLLGASQQFIVSTAPWSPSAREMQLADDCGDLRHERDELLKENAMLRREVERLQRGARRR